MLETYVHDANAIIFTYDVTNIESFRNLISGNREVALVTQAAKAQGQASERDAPIKAVFGNKGDLNHLSQVSGNELSKFSKDYEMQAFVGSAKTGD